MKWKTNQNAKRWNQFKQFKTNNFLDRLFLNPLEVETREQDKAFSTWILAFVNSIIPKAFQWFNWILLTQIQPRREVLMSFQSRLKERQFGRFYSTRKFPSFSSTSKTFIILKHEQLRSNDEKICCTWRKLVKKLFLRSFWKSGKLLSTAAELSQHHHEIVITFDNLWLSKVFISWRRHSLRKKYFTSR